MAGLYECMSSCFKRSISVIYLGPIAYLPTHFRSSCMEYVSGQIRIVELPSCAHKAEASAVDYLFRTNAALSPYFCGIGATYVSTLPRLEPDGAWAPMAATCQPPIYPTESKTGPSTTRSRSKWTSVKHAARNAANCQPVDAALPWRPVRLVCVCRQRSPERYLQALQRGQPGACAAQSRPCGHRGASDCCGLRRPPFAWASDWRGSPASRARSCRVGSAHRPA